MARDILGNEVEVGDLVQITLDKPVMFGKITKIHNGGIAIVGGQKGGARSEDVTLGSIEVTVDLQANFDPRNDRAPGIVKVVDPDNGKRTGILQ